MSKYILAHDMGTSGDKAVLFTLDGKVAKSVHGDYPTYFGENGAVEQNPLDWWKCVCDRTQEILQGIDKKAVSYTHLGLFSGIDRNLAARFSFLMSIPVILGSLVLQGYDLIKTGVGQIAVLPTIVGMLFAAVSGFLAIRFMLNLIRKKKLYGFAVYVGILGILVILDQTVFHLVF